MKFLQSQPFTLRFFRLNLRSFLPPLLPVSSGSGSVPSRLHLNNPLTIPGGDEGRNE